MFYLFKEKNNPFGIYRQQILNVNGASSTENIIVKGFVIVSSIAQVHNGSTGPGNARTWRAERQRLEDHQRAPGLWRRHLGLHHTPDVWQPAALRTQTVRLQFKDLKGL